MAVNGLPQLSYLSREVLQVKQSLFPLNLMSPTNFSSMVADVPCPSGLEAATKNSTTYHFFKKRLLGVFYWKTLGHIELALQLGQVNSLEIISFSPDNCTGFQEWKCGISNASDSLSGESHQVWCCWLFASPASTWHSSKKAFKCLCFESISHFY